MTHILIIGAGLGGLCLAQGLKKAGISFRIFERDSSYDFRAQGYRIRINNDGATALKKNLDQDLWNLFEQTCAETRLGFTSINALDGSVKSSGPGVDPGRIIPTTGTHLGPYTVDRTTLRKLLLLGLEDHVVFGKELSRFEVTDQSVTIYFTDGSTESGTLLVGADGVRSVVRRQYLPQHFLIDTRGRCIYGKTPITPQLLKNFPSDAMNWITLISDSRPVTLFLEPVRFSNNLESVSSGRISHVQDYIYWVLLSVQSIFDISDDKFLSLSGEDAAQLSLSLTEGWDPAIRTLLQYQLPQQSSTIRILSFTPTIPTWEASSMVTLLGDSVHAMSPTGGVGANTALRDAANLCEVIQKGVTKTSIEEYETAMRTYAGEAIQGSFNGAKKMFSLPPFEECKKVEL